MSRLLETINESPVHNRTKHDKKEELYRQALQLMRKMEINKIYQLCHSDINLSR